MYIYTYFSLFSSQHAENVTLSTFIISNFTKQTPDHQFGVPNNRQYIPFVRIYMFKRWNIYIQCLIYISNGGIYTVVYTIYFRTQRKINPRNGICLQNIYPIHADDDDDDFHLDVYVLIVYVVHFRLSGCQ